MTKGNAPADYYSAYVDTIRDFIKIPRNTTYVRDKNDCTQFTKKNFTTTYEKITGSKLPPRSLSVFNNGGQLLRLILNNANDGKIATPSTHALSRDELAAMAKNYPAEEKNDFFTVPRFKLGVLLLRIEPAISEQEIGTTYANGDLALTHKNGEISTVSKNAALDGFRNGQKIFLTKHFMSITEVSGGTAWITHASSPSRGVVREEISSLKDKNCLYLIVDPTDGFPELKTMARRQSPISALTPKEIGEIEMKRRDPILALRKSTTHA